MTQDDLSPIGGSFFLHLWQKFLKNKPSVVWPQTIVFETTIKSGDRSVRERRNLPVHDKNSDSDGHLFLLDQLIKNDWSIILNPILTNKHTGRFRRIVLRRNIHPVIARRSRKNF